MDKQTNMATARVATTILRLLPVFVYIYRSSDACNFAAFCLCRRYVL